MRQPVVGAYIGFKTAFDSVDRISMWANMQGVALPEEIVDILKAIYKVTNPTVKVYSTESSDINLRTGVRQGGVCSTKLFVFLIDWILRMVLEDFRDRVPLRQHNTVVLVLDFADDVAVAAEDASTLQKMVNTIRHYALIAGLELSTEKGKIQHCCCQQPSLYIGGKTVDVAEQFKYMGRIVSLDGGSPRDIYRRIKKAIAAFGMLNHYLWRKRDISLLV